MTLPTIDVPAAIDPRRRAGHVMIGTTDSLCPDCLHASPSRVEVVPAKIVVRGRRVYFRKRCPFHGEREDFVCSDVAWWDRIEGQTPSVLPVTRSTDHRRGCPLDCGLCPDHEQHTCVGLVELTDRCNLSCPMCFASSGPGGRDHSFDSIVASLDRLVAVEGRAEVVQLSGGEPTLHPRFRDVVDAALDRPIDYVMVNTNGIRLAKDPALVAFLGERRQRVEVYFQWDGDDAATNRRIRGEDAAAVKRAALDVLSAAGVNVTLVSTLAAPLPTDFYRSLWDEALSRDNVVGLSLQPATYSGRTVAPEDLETRVTFPDVIGGLADASEGMVARSDFTPLPCAHPNCHQILFAARDGRRIAPIDPTGQMDLIAGGISFTPERAAAAVRAFLNRGGGCGSDCGCGPGDGRTASLSSDRQSPHGSGDGQPAGAPPMVRELFAKVLAGTATSRDMLRVTITSFLDAYNFDVRQVMKCCTHHVLPSGHVIPFCAYNTLYRPGHVPLPPIAAERPQ